MEDIPDSNFRILDSSLHGKFDGESCAWQVTVAYLFWRTEDTRADTSALSRAQKTANLSPPTTCPSSNPNPSPRKKTPSKPPTKPSPLNVYPVERASRARGNGTSGSGPDPRPSRSCTRFTTPSRYWACSGNGNNALTDLGIRTASRSARHPRE